MNLLLNRRVQLRWVVEEDVPRAQALVGDLNIPIITTADAHKIYQDPKYAVLCINAILMMETFHVAKTNDLFTMQAVTKCINFSLFFRVEAVLVCTPSFTHEEIVKNSLKAGLDF